MRWGKHQETMLTIGTYLGILLVCGDRYFIYPISIWPNINSPVFLIGITIFILCYSFLILKSKFSIELLIPGSLFFILLNLVSSGLTYGYIVASDSYFYLGFLDTYIIREPSTFLSKIYEGFYGAFAYLLAIQKVTGINSNTLSIFLVTIDNIIAFFLLFLITDFLFKNKKMALFSTLLYLIFSPFPLHRCPASQGFSLLLLILYFLLNYNRGNPRELSICSIIVVALVSTHHLTVFIYLLALLSVLLFTFLIKNMLRIKGFSKELDYSTIIPHILFVIVVYISWYLYIAPESFSKFILSAFKPELVTLPTALSPYSPLLERLLTKAPLITAFSLTLLSIYRILKEKESFRQSRLLIYLAVTLGIGINFCLVLITGLIGVFSVYERLMVLWRQFNYYTLFAIPIFASTIFYFSKKREAFLIILILLSSNIIFPAVATNPTIQQAGQIYTERDFSMLSFVREKLPNGSIVLVDTPTLAFISWKLHGYRLLSGFKMIYGDAFTFEQECQRLIEENKNTYIIIPQTYVPRFFEETDEYIYLAPPIQNITEERFDAEQFIKVWSNNEYVIYKFRMGL